MASKLKLKCWPRMVTDTEDENEDIGEYEKRIAVGATGGVGSGGVFPHLRVGGCA